MTPTAAASMTEAQARRDLYADILSQAITGELIGMANYAAMVELCPDAASQIDAVEHSFNERGHAAAFEQVARDLEVPVIIDPGATYWARIRRAFLGHVRAGDLSACLIVQELMLESFAVSMYDAVANAVEGRMSDVFRAIAREEESHLQHALDELAPEFRADPDAFEAKVGRLHDEVMTLLAEMVAARDPAGHCGLCRGECAKGALHHIGLSAAELRGRALNYYLRVLDRLGIRGDRSLVWVANLPA